jgi:hypothetical protein
MINNSLISFAGVLTCIVLLFSVYARFKCKLLENKLGKLIFNETKRSINKSVITSIQFFFLTTILLDLNYAPLNLFFYFVIFVFLTLNLFIIKDLIQCSLLLFKEKNDS